MTDEQIVRALYDRLVLMFPGPRRVTGVRTEDSNHVVVLNSADRFTDEGHLRISGENASGERAFEVREITGINGNEVTVDGVFETVQPTPDSEDDVGSASYASIKLDSGGYSLIDDPGWPSVNFIARNRQVYLLPDDKADQAIPVPGRPVGSKILPRIEAETLPIEPEQLSLSPTGSQRRRFLFVASAVVRLDQARRPTSSEGGGQFEAQKIAERIAERFEVGYGQRGERWPYYDIGPKPEERVGYYYDSDESEVTGLWVRARPQIGPGFVLTDANEWRLPVTVRLETLRP